MAEAREWIYKTNPAYVRVFQWNVLADSLATADENGFPFVPSSALNTRHRHELQLKEVLADNADIIALQEVDSPDHIRDTLEDAGYRTMYARREDSPLGVLIAYHDVSFELKSDVTITFTEGTQMAMVVKFHDKHYNKDFVFATTHLKAKHDPESKRIRASQSRELLSYVNTMRTTYPDTSSNRLPAIVAADLNDTPDSATLAWWREWENAYQASDNNTDTTYKMRGTPENKIAKCCTEDYILHTGNTRSVRRLPTDLEEPYLPSTDFPSDHLSLCAKIDITNHRSD